MIPFLLAICTSAPFFSDPVDTISQRRSEMVRQLEDSATPSLQTEMGTTGTFVFPTNDPLAVYWFGDLLRDDSHWVYIAREEMGKIRVLHRLKFVRGNGDRADGALDTLIDSGFVLPRNCPKDVREVFRKPQDLAGYKFCVVPGFLYYWFRDSDGREEEGNINHTFYSIPSFEKLPITKLETGVIQLAR